MRKSGQYWVKIKWPAAVNGYTWVVAYWHSPSEFFVSPLGTSGQDIEVLEIDENMLVYIESQYRPKEYKWPGYADVGSDHRNTLTIVHSLKNIGQILQEIHQQLVISNQKQ